MDERERAFLDRKFSHLFNFYDYDKNGFIEWCDFEKRIADATNHLKQRLVGQEFYVSTFRSLQTRAVRNFFEAVLQHADKDSDCKISAQEWIDFSYDLRQKILATDALPAWLKDVVSGLFACCDVNKDGCLGNDGLEFLPGINEEMQEQCFKILTNNGEIPLDEERYFQLTKDYCCSADPQNESRYLYGFCD
jgi:hypothetical protein